MKNMYLDNFMLETEEYTCPIALSNQIEKVFKTSPEYLGHQAMAPNLHDQIPLPMTDESCFLVNTDQGHRVYVNSCPHRSKKLVSNKINKQNIFCPVHSFLFNSSGALIKSPKFDPCPNLNLHNVNFNSFHGMFFRVPDGISINEWFFDVPNSVSELMKMENYEYCDGITKGDEIIGGHWMLVMELTDDVLHIPHVHPAFNKLMKMSTVKWDFFTNGFIQTIEIDRSLFLMDETELTKKLSKKKYSSTLRYIKVIRKIIQMRPDLADDPTLHHLYLVSLLPGLQIESIPFLKIIQSTHPHTINTSHQVIEYYYRKNLPKELEIELLESSIAIFKILDDEDDLLSKDEQEGIEFLARFGIKERGLPHPYYESGTPYRHAWIGKKLGKIKNNDLIKLFA